MKKTLILIVGLIYLSIFELKAETITLTLTHVVAPTTPKGKAADFFAKRISELSNNEMEIKVFPNSTLYGDSDELKAIKLGYVDMAIPSVSKFTEFVPEMQIFDLPFLFKDLTHIHKVLDGDIGNILKNKLASKGFIATEYWDAGFKQLSANKDINTIKDLYGLKMRIMSSDVLQAQFEAANSIPISLPFSEVYKAMKNKVIDGSENPLSNFVSKKFYEVQKSITLSNHGYLGYIVIFNKNKYNSLNINQKNIITKALKETTEFERLEVEKDEEKNLEKLKELNFPIIELSSKEKESFKQVLQTIYPKFEEIIGKELLNKIN